MLVADVLSSPEIGELAKAMVKVQQTLNPACKDAENPFVKNRYASLNSVIEACREALTAQSTIHPIRTRRSAGRAAPAGWGGVPDHRRLQRQNLHHRFRKCPRQAGLPSGSRVPLGWQSQAVVALRRLKCRVNHEPQFQGYGPAGAPGPWVGASGRIEDESRSGRPLGLCRPVRRGPRHHLSAGGSGGHGQTFPQLCRHLFGIDIPDRAAAVDLEGWVLCPSMSDARPFGPYRPDPTMLNLCRRTAHRLWQGVQNVKSGRTRLDNLDTCAGFHPLCGWCDHAEGCPKFTTNPVSDPTLDMELAAFSRLKVEKSVLEAEIEMCEARIRHFFRHTGKCPGWLSTGHFRFKTAHIAGRKAIDSGKLRAILANRIGADEAEALLTQVTSTGAEYERLTVSPVKPASV